MSQRRVLEQERTASSSFIDQMLRPDKDKAFLIHFDREVGLDQDLTSSREKLRSALDSLQAPQFTQTGAGNSSGQGGYPGRHGSHHDGSTHGGGTLLYDAVFLASDELMKKQTGRKALIVLSDGDDRGSKETCALLLKPHNLQTQSFTRSYLRMTKIDPLAAALEEQEWADIMAVRAAAVADIHRNRA